MTWETQTNPEIKFISPELNVFIALWKNNERSLEKKLGIFDPPKFKGSIVQDMDVKSVSYPLTIYFDDSNDYTDLKLSSLAKRGNHYSKAEAFFKACQNEKGQWEVTHPTKGVLILQLVSVREVIDPTETGSYTMFETQWLEPANIERLITAPELGALVLLGILDAIADGIAQLQQLRSDLYSAVQAGLNMINKVAGLTNTVMSELAATQNLINDSWNEAKNTLTNLQTAFQSNPSDPDIQGEIGQALIDVVSIPLEANDNYDTRIDYYDELANELYSQVPTGSDPEDYNKALFFELSMIAILISGARIIVTSNFKTRSEIISAIEKVQESWNNIIASIDGIQENFENVDIDKQYFGNSQAYTSLVNTYTLVMQYLLSQFFNLATEKRFTIKNKRSPLEVCITEYGTPDNYDLFIESNELTGDEILLLNPGREIVIYA